MDKACRLLDLLGEAPQGLAVSEIARQVGLVKSTTHRLLTTLMKRGFVEQDAASGHYKLGYKVLDLGMKLLSAIDLRREAAPLLQALALRVNEAVHLAHQDGGEIVYIDKVESTNTIRMHSRIGTRVPVHATALGKVMLAFQSSDEANALIDRCGLAAKTAHTITDRTRFLRALAETRTRGYAFDLEENEPGVCCVAAPIRDSSGRVAAACSVSGPSLRMTPERLAELVPDVTQTAALISERLGHRETATR